MKIKNVPISKEEQEEKRILNLIKKFDSISLSLKTCDGYSLYKEKDCVHWINPKPKEGSKATNFYAFDRRDFGKLNRVMNEISSKESKMKEQGYNLEGVKSFNRNIWMDLSRESNAIEGIMDDFSYDLLDFKTKLSGQFAVDPSTEDFDRHTYFKKLKEQANSIEASNDRDCVIINGNKKTHTLKIETIKHFIAFKYVYKCAKKDKKSGKSLTANEFSTMINYVATMLTGGGLEYFPFRDMVVAILGANWSAVSPKDIDVKIDALCNWFVDPKQSGGLHPIEKAAIFHAEFIRIHPFIDGNGRTGRIMTNYALIWNELPTIAVRHKNTQAYFDAISKAVETHEIDDLITIFYKEVCSSAVKIDGCLKYIERTQKPIQKPEQGPEQKLEKSKRNTDTIIR